MPDTTPEFRPVAVSAEVPLRSARRRLLRGTFSAPVVLALSSGSVLASTSSPLRCFNNATQGVDSPGSQYFRVKRWLGKVDGNSVHLVKGSDISGLAILHGFGVGSFGGTVAAENWIQVNTSSLVFGVSPAGGSDLTVDSVWLALRLERTTGTGALPADYTVTGISTSSTQYVGGTGGKPVTTSCWGSFT